MKLAQQLWPLLPWLLMVMGYSLPTRADEAPDASLVRIVNVSYTGTGCPEGTVSSNLTPDARTVSVLFGAFVAQAGRRQGFPQQDQKGCVVSLEMSIPQGWSASLFTADIRGFAAVDKKAFGQVSVAYAFNGVYGNFFSMNQLVGPRNEDYLLSQAIPFESINWSGCGGSQTLGIQSNIFVQDGDDGKAAATLTVDSIDGTLKQLYGVQWRHCGSGAPETVQLHRFINGNGQSKNDWGRLITSNPNESSIYPKFKYEAPAFKVYKEKTDAEMIPIFRCFLNAWGGGFVSADPNCENNTIIGQYGYVYPTARAGHSAIYRFYGPISYFHRLATTNPAEGYAAKYTFQDIIGYAPDSSASPQPPAPPVPQPPTPQPPAPPMPSGPLGYLDIVGNIDISGLIYWSPGQAKIIEGGGAMGQITVSQSGAPMPADQRVQVLLEKFDSSKKLNRGSVTVVQTANVANGNTYVLRIDDPSKSYGAYRLRLNWRPVF